MNNKATSDVPDILFTVMQMTLVGFINSVSCYDMVKFMSFCQNRYNTSSEYHKVFVQNTESDLVTQVAGMILK